MSVPFFILIASLRCFLEMRVLAPFDDFSYFTLLHHVLWYVTAILSVILFLSLYLKKSPLKLLWLCYGGVIILIPVGHSMATHTPMNLDYFTGAFLDIIRYSLSAGWEYERNRPQFFAIITLDIGIFFTGFLYSRSIKKAFVSLISVHLILTLVGTKWFSDQDRPETLILIRSAYTGHVFMALIWLQTASLLTLVLGLIETRRWGVGVQPISLFFKAWFSWMLMALFLYLTGILNKGFDAITVASPMWAIILLYHLLKKREGLKKSPPMVPILAIILVTQLLVTIPLYFPRHFDLNPRKIVAPFFYSN